MSGRRPRDRHVCSDGKAKTPHTREEAEARIARIAVHSVSPERHRLTAYECHCGAWHIGKPALPRNPARDIAQRGAYVPGRRSVQRHPELVLELGERATAHLLHSDARLLNALLASPFTTAPRNKDHRRQLRSQRRYLASLGYTTHAG